MNQSEMSARSTIARIAFTTGNPVIFGVVAWYEGEPILEFPVIMTYQEAAELLVNHDFSTDAVINQLGYMLIERIVRRGMDQMAPEGSHWQGFVSPMIGLN